MKKNQLFSVLFTLLLLSGTSFAQYDKYPIERFNVPGPIVFLNKTYTLAQTSYSPDTATYNIYKQQYLANGDTLAMYRSMLIIHVFTGNTTMEDVATAKLDELRELQKANPVVNYQSFNNKKTGEYMIDFLTTENSSDGQYIDMAERNVYRYTTLTDTSGKDYVLLWGVSTRSYGDDVEQFINDLKSKKKLDLIKSVGMFKVPEIRISK